MDSLKTFDSVITPLLPEEIRSSSEMLYKRLENCTIARQYIETSEFNDSIIKNIEISDSVYRNCDFDSTLIVNCRFENVHFEGCDFSSTHIRDCVFVNCFIHNSDIADNVWSHVKFEHTELKENHILNSHIYDCLFSNSAFCETTAHLNYFSRCSLIGVDFSGSSFSFNIFSDTKLDKCILQCNNIGTLHGLNVRDIAASEFTLCYVRNALPKDFKFTEENFCDTMTASYVKCKLFFAAAFCRISYSDSYIHWELSELCRLLRTSIIKIGNVRVLYLDYIAMLLPELLRSGKIGTMSIQQVLDTLSYCIEQCSVDSVLAEKLQRVCMVCRELLAQTSAHSTEQLQGDRNDLVLLKFHFRKKPEIDTKDFCAEIEQIVGGQAEVLYEGPGSYIAVILSNLQTASEIISMVGVCMYGIVKIAKDVGELLPESLEIGIEYGKNRTIRTCSLEPYQPGAKSEKLMKNVKITKFATSQHLFELLIYQVPGNKKSSFLMKYRKKKNSEKD